MIVFIGAECKFSSGDTHFIVGLSTSEQPCWQDLPREQTLLDPILSSMLLRKYLSKIQQ